jgi:hypothetical protein
MAETVQKNFRMSSRSIELLHEVARAHGMTETEVVETCVAKYAEEIGQDVERARDLFFEQICGAVAKSPTDTARVYISKDLLVPLDRLAERFNTTRGKLVEGLILEAQSKDQVAAEDLERGKGRAGRKGAAAEAEAAESSAGGLASMAGEKWSEGKKEKGKKTGLHRGHH